MTQLLAFHNDPSIKIEFETRVEKHRAADAIVQSYGYWNKNEEKGCALGCTLECPKGNHADYETRLGIPRVLARLEDRIFEGASVEWSKTWPGRFLQAIPVGADLSGVWAKFAVWLLIDEQHGVVRYAKRADTVAAIRAVASAYERSDVKREEWLELRQQASAAYAASAAYDASAAARKQAFERQGEKLLELMAAAPIPQAA
jgi:hypothetical protein